MSATHGQEHVRYVIARLYAPDLKRASAIQRLLHDVNRAKYRVRTAEESAQDDSASSDSTASSPTTPGVLTPPASLPQTPQPVPIFLCSPNFTADVPLWSQPVKDDASNSRGIITYRASRPVTGRVFPVRRLGETPAEFAYHDGRKSCRTVA
ncbi:hypothetical protein FKP32DRAFT_561877 [Trametes sanguinea]|nr:hypothetical protein FKP32DRAFT_561877 [Trametes sanguinea]